jgi:hypothetical protein
MPSLQGVLPIFPFVRIASLPMSPRRVVGRGDFCQLVLALPGVKHFCLSPLGDTCYPPARI